MRVRMTASVPASPDGLSPKQLYREDTVYDVPEPIGEMFLRAGWADAVGKKEQPSANKQDKGPGENK